MHTKMHETYEDTQLFNIQRKQHTYTFQHSHVHHNSWNSRLNYGDEIISSTYLLMENSFRNQLRRYNVPPNHRPTYSSISQQHYHPRAGHDSPRNKGLSRLTHSQGTQFSQAHIVGLIRLSRSWEKLN